MSKSKITRTPATSGLLFLAVVLALALTAATTLAQSATGEIVGKVTDPNRAVVAGVLGLGLNYAANEAEKAADIQQIIDNTIVKRIAEPEWGPPLGRVLSELVEENRHLPLVEMLAERAHQWAMGSQETIDRVISRDSPSWSPKFVDLLLGERIHRELVEFTWKVRSNPDHEVRLAVNKFLADYARDLQSDPATIAKAEKVKAEIMGRDEVTQLAGATWRTAKRMILDSVDDPNSTLRTKVAENVMALGVRLREDHELRTKVDGWLLDAVRFVGNRSSGRMGLALAAELNGYPGPLLDAVRFVASTYADEITSVIRETVERWDAEEASRKIELAVGRDLQFIRINGTVVGSLAGLAIYTISELLFA